jgi:hypothetical protein
MHRSWIGALSFLTKRIHLPVPGIVIETKKGAKILQVRDVLPAPAPIVAAARTNEIGDEKHLQLIAGDTQS